MKLSSEPISPLACIKLLHTVIWAFFVACILALPIAGFLHRFDWAAALGILVLLECIVLALNHFRCPLTDVAASYTQDRRDNFDIYLPLWLARHNKTIFGTLFLAGGLLALWQWLLSTR